MKKLFKILTIVCIMVDLVFAVLPSLVTLEVLIICFIITLVFANLWVLGDCNAKMMDSNGYCETLDHDYLYYPDRD